MTLESYFRNYKTEQTVFRYLFFVGQYSIFCHVNYDKHYEHVRATSGHDIFDQISVLRNIQYMRIDLDDEDRFLR